MASCCTKMRNVYSRRPFVTTNFQSFNNNSNKSQDIVLKFSACVHHKFVLNWHKNFGHCSISLPATAHFGQNFGRLQRPHLLEFFFEKNFGEVLDLYQLAIGRNFEYLEKNGVFKFFKSLPVHLITTSTNQRTFNMENISRLDHDYLSEYFSED